MMINTTECYSLILVYMTWTLNQGQSSNSTGMKLNILLRLVGLTNLILILAHLIDIQGREPYLCDFMNKKNNSNAGFHSEIYQLMSVQLDVW